ncbi:hypothetical protein GW17_00046743 [Ensete ventricosum]|nr:hypothetical protein GW17_00046743 [Ensete ventricosum]RZS23215.1 hypothetical protein BHM03_00056110 [Ensete ventricosum]
MKVLGWWLMMVGALRLASVWFGFFDIWALRMAVFSQTQSTNYISPFLSPSMLLICFRRPSSRYSRSSYCSSRSVTGIRSTCYIARIM